MFATPSFTNRIMSENNFKEIPLLMNLGWHFEFFEILQQEGNQLHLAQFAMSCLSNVYFPPGICFIIHLGAIHK